MAAINHAESCAVTQSFNQYDAAMCQRDAHDESVTAIAENMLATLPAWAANLIEANESAYDAVIALAEKALADDSRESWDGFDFGDDE